MRCVKNFFLFWRRRLAAYQCLKLLLAGQLRRTILPKGPYGVALSVGELDTTFQLRGGTLPLSYRHPSEIFFVNAWVSDDVMMCRWGVTKEPTIGDKMLS